MRRERERHTLFANCRCSFLFPPSLLLSRLSFLTEVQMSRDIRCKSNHRRDDIPFPRRNGTMCSRKAAEVAKKGKGMEDVRNLAQKSITCDARGGKERFIRRDNNEMNVGAAAASELSIKGFRRDILPGSRDNKSHRSSFAIGRASAPEAVASFAEIESSGGPQIEMDHLHFLRPTEWLRHASRFVQWRYTAWWNVEYVRVK